MEIDAECTSSQARLELSTGSYVVVVYHVTIVAIGHGLLKKFWPFGTRLRSTHCREFNFFNWNAECPKI